MLRGPSSLSISKQRSPRSTPIAAANGLPSLVLDARLSRAAAAHSADQARRGRMGHSGSDGSGPMDRAARAGYRPKIASENVAAGYKSFSDVMRGWEQLRPP